MAEQTNISWADMTFNPWIGCTEVSVGEKGACVGCYAREQAKRYGWPEWGNHPRKRTSEANWKKPLKWDRDAATAGTRPFVFCASLADVFDNQVPPEWRRDLFDLIRATPNLVWLLLTKRPQNIERLFGETLIPPGAVGYGLPASELWTRWPRNAAIGCTVVTQEEAERDIPHLLAAKAMLNPAFAFLSMEPPLGTVDLGKAKALPVYWEGDHGEMRIFDGHSRRQIGSRPRRGWAGWTNDGRWVDWVITGGETDQGKHRARPSHPDWFRSIRDQCAAAGVPFHFKQWGEWREVLHDLGETIEVDPDSDEAAAILEDVVRPAWISRAGRVFTAVEDLPEDLPCRLVERVGKKAAGRLLDGVLHDARPQVPTLQGAAL